MDLASQMDRFAVVLAELEPDRVEVLEVGFDSPVAPNLCAEARAADAGTTSRNLEQELDPLRADHPGKAFIGAGKLDIGHERTLATSTRERPAPRRRSTTRSVTDGPENHCQA